MTKYLIVLFLFSFSLFGYRYDSKYLNSLKKEVLVEKIMGTGPGTAGNHTVLEVGFLGKVLVEKKFRISIPENDVNGVTYLGSNFVFAVVEANGSKYAVIRGRLYVNTVKLLDCSFDMPSDEFVSLCWEAYREIGIYSFDFKGNYKRMTMDMWDCSESTCLVNGQTLFEDFGIKEGIDIKKEYYFTFFRLWNKGLYLFVIDKQGNKQTFTIKKF